MESCSADNIVNVGAGPVPNTPQNIIDLLLNVGYRIDVIHNWHLKDLLTSMSYNGEHISEIWVQLPLVEERSSVENCQVRASLHGSNDVGLQWEKIGIRYYQVIKSLDINNRLTFLSVRSRFPNYKDWKTERGMGLCIDQTALPLKLVKRLVNKGLSFVTKWVDLWFNGMKPTLPVSTQGHGHPSLRQYLDKAKRFPDRRKLVDKI